ncbi:MAG TPA: hypothetical protein VGF59_27515 [Bryobacteraceae bacterium]
MAQTRAQTAARFFVMGVYRGQPEGGFLVSLFSARLGFDHIVGIEARIDLRQSTGGFESGVQAFVD